MELGKVAGIFKSIELMKSIESVELIGLMGLT